MKECAICSKELIESYEHALLFIGKYGHRYEICPYCESLMDRFVAPKDSEDKKEAAEALYTAMFEEGAVQKSPEMLAYFSSLFAKDSEAVNEAKDAVEKARERETPPDATDAGDTNGSVTDENEPSEEDFVASAEPKKVSLATKLLFLALFLLLGGGALALGIIRSSVFTIVIGAVIILLGIASVFAKD